MHPHKKKKKKREKSSTRTSPSLLKKRDLKPITFVERSLDFGQDTTSASTAHSAARRQYLTNRYVILSTDSNVSSVVDDIPSPASTISSTNDTFTPKTLSTDTHSILFRHPSTSTNTDTPISTYGTPSSHSHNSSPPLPSHIIPDFPIPLPTSTTFTSATTSTTTSITAASLTTTTSLTFVHPLIPHSTPNHSPPLSPKSQQTLSAPAYKTPLSPPSPPPLSKIATFRSEYAASPSLPLASHISDDPPRHPITTQNKPKIPTTATQSCLYPLVLVQDPPNSLKPKRKREKTPSNSPPSPDFSDKSMRKSNTIPRKNLSLDIIEPLQSSSPPPTQTSSSKLSSPVSTSNKPPAIHIYTTNNSQLIKHINNIVSVPPSYKFNNTSLICFPNAISDHPKILKMLGQSNIEFYTHNPLNVRPIKLAAKYVPQDVLDDDILDDLRIKGLPILMLSRVMIFKQGKRVPSNILILTIPQEAAHSYRALTDICYFKITISDYQGSPINQCHNCQGFAHSSEVCGKASKCIKCGLSHRGQPCTSTALKCANCAASHPANFCGCPAYQAALQRFGPKQLRNPSTQPPTVPTSPPPISKQNFPPLPSQVNHHLPAPPPTTSAWQKTPTPATNSHDNPLKEIIALLKSFRLAKI